MIKYYKFYTRLCGIYMYSTNGDVIPGGYTMEQAINLYKNVYARYQPSPDQWTEITYKEFLAEKLERL